MRKMIVLICGIIMSASICFGQVPSDATKVPGYLQDVSVTIKAGDSQGSGIILVKGDRNFILTAAHVVEGLRKVRTKIVDGADRKVVEFEDPVIMQKYVENGREVGHVEFFGKVIKYSDADHGHDLALIEVRKRNAFPKYVEFYKDNNIPSVGTTAYLCGSLLGEQGSNSLTKGTLSQTGRLINGKVFDQGQLGAFPGASGCGIYLENGTCIGILLRGAGEGFNLYCPVRRVQEWVNEAGIKWVIDPTINVPSDDELSKVSVEN